MPGAPAFLDANKPELLKVGDEKYEYYRTERVWSGNPLKRYPERIAVPKTVDEVVQAVKYAREKQLHIGVRSGGHCHNAPSVRDGALLIDLVNLKELQYDGKTGILTASPSTTGRMAQEHLKPFNHFFPGGHCADVALGGFLSQGGAGIMWRDVGWAGSLIKWMDVVTSAGELIHVSPTENADLLWAFIGSGHGFFGVVVRFGLKPLPLSKYNLRSWLVAPGSSYRKIMQWALDVGDIVAPRTEFYIVSIKRKHFMPGGDPDEIIMRVQCSIWAESEAAAKEGIRFVQDCPAVDEAYAKEFNEPVTIDAEYAVQDSISFKGTWIITSGWIAGDTDKQVDLIEKSMTTLPSYESNTIMYSCHPYGPGSRHDFANDITAGTYVFSYTCAADSDPDPDIKAKCSDWVSDVWGEIDQKSGEALASGDPSAARTKGFYTGDCNLEHRGGRFMSEENWAKWTSIRDKYDPTRSFVGYLKNPKFPINWNAFDGPVPAGRSE